MKSLFLLLLMATTSSAATPYKLASDIPYENTADKRQVLDVYAPPSGKDLPVVFWMHGGGWVTGDKTEVQLKPRAFTERGFVFVSTNYRLLPQVQMGDLIRDVAKALGWVYAHINQYGGDRSRIFVMGHSAGAQLAALLCTDNRYLNAEGVPIDALKGCVPVDGDTYDLPAIIMTAEVRQTLHGLPLPSFGHRVKFGNDPKNFVEYSAVTHIAKGKSIPPFLILHVAGHPDVTAQAKRLEAVLTKCDISAKVYAAHDTYHNKLNDDLGKEHDSSTLELFSFLEALLQHTNK